MTRDEARQLINKHSFKDKFDRYVLPRRVAYIIADCIVNEELSNRNCSNCKKCLNIHHYYCCKTMDKLVEKDFYCNKWESK